MILTPIRTVRTAAPLAALVLALAACGNDPREIDAAGPGGGTTVSTAPDTPVSSPSGDQSDPGDGDGTIQYEPVEPQPGATGLRPSAFDPDASVAAGDGVLVRFTSGVAPCYVLGKVDVAETATSVTITLFIGHEADAGDVACIEIAKFYEVLVPLEVPLGERTLIDGSA
jgi:hypothetical protein